MTSFTTLYHRIHHQLELAFWNRTRLQSTWPAQAQKEARKELPKGKVRDCGIKQKKLVKHWLKSLINWPFMSGGMDQSKVVTLFTWQPDQLNRYMFLTLAGAGGKGGGKGGGKVLASIGRWGFCDVLWTLYPYSRDPARLVLNVRVLSIWVATKRRGAGKRQTYMNTTWLIHTKAVWHSWYALKCG